MVVVVVSDCILTSTSFVLTPRNIISPIAHRHQVAISWSRHVQRRTKRFDFADSDQSNFVRGSPSSVFPLPGRQIVSRSRSLRYPMSRKFLPFSFFSLPLPDSPYLSIILQQMGERILEVFLKSNALRVESKDHRLKLKETSRDLEEN